MVFTITRALQEGEQILKNAGIKNYKIEAREILENLLTSANLVKDRDFFSQKKMSMKEINYPK